jgi:hypothetical protein
MSRDWTKASEKATVASVPALEVEWRKGRKTGCREPADVAQRIVAFEYHHRKAVSLPYG